MSMIRIENLETFIRDNVSGCTAVSVDTVTEPKMRKTGNPFMGVKKVQRKNGLIGFDYQNSVNNEAGRENLSEREVKPRTWGTLSKDRLFVYHKENVYLQMKVQSVAETHYIMPNGDEIPAEEIKPFLYEHKTSSTQSGFENEVIVNDIKFSSIMKIRLNNMEIEVSA